jgi:hypothetical protein
LLSNIIISGTLILAAYFLFRFLLKLFRKPVLEISPSPLDHPEWSDPERIKSFINAFQKNGFDLAGHYKIQEIPSLIISGLVKPSERLAGVVYDHPAAGIWVDVFVQYEDGGSLTASNAPTGDELDHMPQQIKLYSKECNVGELIEKVKKERRETGRIAITKEEFAPHFKEQYRKEMKWRMERGGPTPLEVTRAAVSTGQSLDTAKMQNAAQKIKSSWLKEKSRQSRIESPPSKAILPGEFEQPELFRRKMEQASAPVPRLYLPAMPCYIVFVSLLVSWSYYGYRYNEAHFPVSWTALIVFLLVFAVLFLLMMVFREYHRRIRIYPVLKRMAEYRPGAFLVMLGSLPTLFYARENWIGRVSFEEGDDSKNAFTRLDAVARNSTGWLSIRRKTFLNKVLGRSDKDGIQLPESDFSRNFEVSGSDKAFVEIMLNSNIPSVMTRLLKWKEPFMEIDRHSVIVQIGNDLSGARKEVELRYFLESAESIVETVSRQSGQ